MGREDGTDGVPATGGQSRRLAVYLLVGLFPWTVLLVRDSVTLVFVFGLVTPDPLHLTDIVSYVFVHTRALPRFLAAWPAGALAYILGIASAAIGTRFGREDRRLTAGFLAIAGLTQLLLAWGLFQRGGTLALPVGTLALWTAVWWYEWPVLGE